MYAFRILALWSLILAGSDINSIYGNRYSWKDALCRDTGRKTGHPLAWTDTEQHGWFCSVSQTSGQIAKRIMRRFPTLHLLSFLSYSFPSSIVFPFRSLPPWWPVTDRGLPYNTVWVLNSAVMSVNCKIQYKHFLRWYSWRNYTWSRSYRQSDLEALMLQNDKKYVWNNISYLWNP